MNTFLQNDLYVLLLLVGGIIVSSAGELFLVSPGDGDESVYSPVEVNTTFYCVVNNTNLVWEIDMLAIDSLIHKFDLETRRIFQSGPITSLDGVTRSHLTVFGMESNNNSRICCRSLVENRELQENCTTLILYDRPSPPQNVKVQTTEVQNVVNISWTATTMMGVNQSYIVNFVRHSFETKQFYCIHQLSTFAKECDKFLAFIKAVNRAGESYPSKYVTTPSLPDIGPVAASLTHQVWKSGGEIMVSISFQPARYCVDYPLLSYELVLRSEQTGRFINISLNSNETEIVLDADDGLENNQKYMYVVSAINSFGKVVSNKNGSRRHFSTLDVQAVNATVVGESTIDVQCLFIRGSDAVGCKITFVSECPDVADKNVNIIRSDKSNTGRLILTTYNISCYLKLFAYHIDANNTLSNVSIEGRIRRMANNESPGHIQFHIAAIVTVGIALIVVITVAVVAASFTALKKTKYNKKSTLKVANIFSSRPHVKTEFIKESINSKCVSSQSECQLIMPEKLPVKLSTSQNQGLCLQSLNPAYNFSDKHLQQSSHTSLSQLPALVTSMDTYPDTSPGQSVPLHAIPENLNMKEGLGSPATLEDDRTLHNDTISSSHCSVPDLHPPSKIGSSRSLVLDTPPQSTENLKDIAVSQSDTECISPNMPLYAVPDKVKSKSSSERDQASCPSKVELESGKQLLIATEKQEMQEPFYYVLDNNNAPCKDVPCSAGTSDISPKEELSCADCDLPPVYQDITELPSKANTEIGHKDELERRNNEDDHLLSNPNSPQENKL